jgi:hypothetical protein
LDSSDSDNREIYHRRKRRLSSPTDYKNKIESAVDFFDINEMAEESTNELADKIAVDTSGNPENGSDQKNGDESDKQLMPPPPPHMMSKQDETDDSKSE